MDQVIGIYAARRMLKEVWSEIRASVVSKGTMSQTDVMQVIDDFLMKGMEWLDNYERM